MAAGLLMTMLRPWSGQTNDSWGQSQKLSGCGQVL